MELLKNLEGMSADEQMTAVVELQKAAMKQLEEQKQVSIGKSAEMVIQGLKKIKSDFEAKFDSLNYDIQAKVANLKDGEQGIQGPKGDQGDRGLDGANGRDGRDGKDGQDGLDGVDGVGVRDAKIDFDGSLVISLTDGREINCGEVVSVDVAKQIQKVTHNIQTGSGGDSQTVLDAIAALQATIATYGTMATQNKTSVDIEGGTIDNTTIGATTPSTGVFTTLTAQTEVLKGTGSNLVLRSQAWATSPWFNGGLTSITNNTSDVTDPLGGNTATKIVATGSSSAVGQPLTLIASPQTASVYLRTLSGTATCDLIVYLGASPFTNIGTVSVTITSSWQRFSVVTSTATAASYNIQLNNISASTIYGWGAQLEIGSTLNTYIPTTTTAVYGTPTLSFSGVSTIGLQSDGSLYVQPAGTGALQAQATTSSAVGGNARGANAVDWQTARGSASSIASATNTVVGGGYGNTASGGYAVVAGGLNNTASGIASAITGGSSLTSSGTYSASVGGNSNTNSGYYGSLVGGQSNTSAGYYNFIGGGFTNSGTSGSAVTTQSGTMNGTTAVTLSGSNANIKVGQLVTGTRIAIFTYVAAISGTSLTLSQAASGSSTSTLSFFTPHGVVVGGGNNQATGSYSFIGGGGNAGTSSQRNVASGDWSTVAGGVSNTSSGLYCSILGGLGNIASSYGCTSSGGVSNQATGYIATTVGGYANVANGAYSTVFGWLGSTRAITGYTGFSSSAITQSNGVSQAGLIILGAQTTNATATVLTSEPSAASTTNQVILPNNSAYYFRGEVVAGVTGGGNTKGWTIEGVIKRGANAASTALVGTPTVTSSYADAGASTWTIAVTADTTNGGLAVTFTGQAGTTIRVVAQLRTTEMTF
jgi:hypothetical protein